MIAEPAEPLAATYFPRWLASKSPQALQLSNAGNVPLPHWTREGPYSVIFDGFLYDRDILGEARLAENEAQLVLAAYLRWGEEVFHRLKGIFALIIWDGSNDLLLCGRDPLGVYPLFYAKAQREWLFSTEIEVLLQHPYVSRELNPLALAENLYARSTDLEETSFLSIRRVPPGHVLRVRLASQDEKVYRYWHPTFLSKSSAWVREDELEQFDALMDQAVSRCLRLGRTGIFLSGGLDSTTVATFAADVCRREGWPLPRALSLVFPDPECNEEAVQRGIAAGLKIPQTLVSFHETTNQGMLPASLELNRSWPAPLMNTFVPAYLYLGRQGEQQGCRVILTGCGGDEWFTVFYRLAADLIATLDVGGLRHLWNTSMAAEKMSPYRLGVNLLWWCGLRPLLIARGAALLRRVAPETLRARRLRRIRHGLPQWFAPDPLLREALCERIERGIKEPKGGFYRREIEATLNSSLVTMEMEENFESGRRNGLLILNPLWDPDVVDFLARTPPHLLNLHGRSKGILRRILHRRFPRLGFDRQGKVLATDFFRATTLAEAGRVWKTMEGVKGLAQLGIVDAAVANQKMSEALEAQRSQHANQIWHMLGLEAWVWSRLERR